MPSNAAAIAFPGEEKSNECRRQIALTEPVALRTYTPTQAILSKSAGAYHWTPEGRKLADFSSGVLVANLGHNPVPWWNRVIEIMGLSALKGSGDFASAAPLTSYNAITEMEVEAASRLLSNLRSQSGGQRMEQVLWAASGSEAIQKALWASMRRAPGRDMVLATRRGFHGKKGIAGAVTGTESDPDRDSRVRFLKFPTDECADISLRCKPLNVEPYRLELESLYKEFGNRIGTLITEPYLGGGGSFHPQPDYVQLLQSFCRQHDIVFIFDEIQSNFGRTGPMYAYSHYGIEPDVVCLGKGLGNGIPVSAAVGRADIFSSLNYGEGSDTFSAIPLACAAVIATLDAFEKTDVLAKGQRLATVLERGLVRLKDTGVIARVRGEGCVWGIECASVGALSAEQVAIECVRRCYLGDSQARAIHLLGPLAGKVLRISPPLIMEPTEAEYYLDAMFGLLSTIRTAE